jgi:hypothetical protein
MANISFVRASAPAGSVSFNQNPDALGHGGTEEYFQPEGYSDGGDFYCYDKGINPLLPLSFQWSAMDRGTDFSNLKTFYEAMKGKRYTWTYTDIFGASHTARFNSKLTWLYDETGENLRVSFDIMII